MKIRAVVLMLVLRVVILRCSITFPFVVGQIAVLERLYFCPLSSRFVLCNLDGLPSLLRDGACHHRFWNE